MKHTDSASNTTGKSDQKQAERGERKGAKICAFSIIDYIYSVLSWRRTIPKSLDRLRDRLNLHNASEEALRQAFTHTSAAPVEASYEALELLGDQVIPTKLLKHLVATHTGRIPYQNMRGIVHRFKSNDFFRWVSDRYRLHTYIITGPRQRVTAKMRADVVESLIGAVEVDAPHLVDQLVYEMIGQHMCAAIPSGVFEPEPLLRHLTQTEGSGRVDIRYSKAKAGMKRAEVEFGWRGTRQTMTAEHRQKAMARQQAFSLAVVQYGITV